MIDIKPTKEKLAWHSHNKSQIAAHTVVVLRLAHSREVQDALLLFLISGQVIPNAYVAPCFDETDQL